MPSSTSTLTITPLGAGFAARVDDVRLSDAEHVAADLRHALATHKVLVFPSQHLTPDELVRAGRLFGPLTPAHPVLPPLDADHPEVLEIDATRSRTDERYQDEWENDTWHTDVSFMPDPPLGSLLHGVVIPPVGGDTAFADLQGAYDALSRPLRDLVDGLGGDPRRAHRVRRLPARPSRRRAVDRRALHGPGARHPSRGAGAPRDRPPRACSSTRRSRPAWSGSHGSRATRSSRSSTRWRRRPS